MTLTAFMFYIKNAVVYTVASCTKPIAGYGLV